MRGCSKNPNNSFLWRIKYWFTEPSGKAPHKFEVNRIVELINPYYHYDIHYKCSLCGVRKLDTEQPETLAILEWFEAERIVDRLKSKNYNYDADVNASPF